MHTCAYTCTPANTVVKNSNPVSYGKPNSTETLRLERKRCLVLCKIITQTRINRNDSVVKHTIDSIFFIFLDSIFYKDFIFQTSLTFIALFPGGSVVRNLHEVQEMRVWSLGWEDPLEEGMATHSSILAQRIPLTEEPGGLQCIGSQRVGHDWSNLAHTHALNCRDRDFLYTLPMTYAQPPLLSTAPTRWVICSTGWTYADALSSPKVQSLH